MEQSPNPYRTPEAPVEPDAEAAAPYHVRWLVRALVVAQVALLALAAVLPETLPPDLLKMRDDRDTAFLVAHGPMLAIVILLHLVALFGLWRELSWAAWLFLAANAVGYALELVSGPRINSDLASAVDSLADVAVGATLVATYLGGYFTRARRGAAT